MYSFIIVHLFSKRIWGRTVWIYLRFFRKSSNIDYIIHYVKRGELNWDSGDQDSSADLPLTCWDLSVIMLLTAFPVITSLFLPFPQNTILSSFWGDPMLQEQFGRVRVGGCVTVSYSKLIMVIPLSLVSDCFRNKRVTQFWPMRWEWGACRENSGKAFSPRTKEKMHSPCLHLILALKMCLSPV